MGQFVFFDMADQRPKRHSMRAQARGLIFKVFNYFKRKQTTDSQCAELHCASEASGFGVVNWKWNKSTVILTK
jgi:hypothetical protein